MHPAGAQLALDDGNLENARLLECALVCAAQAAAVDAGRGPLARIPRSSWRR
jgi:hypothetical protein